MAVMKHYDGVAGVYRLSEQSSQRMMDWFHAIPEQLHPNTITLSLFRQVDDL